METLVSVIIPVYNHAHTLLRSVESVLAQTHRPLEIIIVNDGSTDAYETAKSDVENLMSRYQLPSAQSSTVVYFRTLTQEHLGAPAARNKGFKESSGQYVIFWDADTVAKPGMLGTLLKTLNEHPAASYAYSQFKFGWKAMKSQPFNGDDLKRYNYIDATSLIRRSDFPKHGWDESLKRFQDWDLWLTLAENKKSGVFVPEVLFTKQVGSRKGMSRWLPSLAYKLPWKTATVRDYEAAKKIVLAKHHLV